MPRGANWDTEQTAMKIVLREEVARGWRPQRLSKAGERREGCDFLSYPPDGDEPDRVEVKGRGASSFMPRGFGYGVQVNAEQLERALRHGRWRLEIVANLTAAREGTGAPERLTLSATEVVKRRGRSCLTSI
jgi:hypothetical protein